MTRIENTDQEQESHDYLEEYEDLEVHRGMLRDTTRTRVYQQAIFSSVRPGDVVLDMGTGTGVLSLFAAQAGAKQVYAVERTNIAEFAAEMVKRNGLSDRIEIIQNDIENVSPPEKVDVILSEWLGVYGVNENLLTPLLTARDRWLKPGGRMLPDRVTVWLAPVSNPDLEQDRNFWLNRPYDLDMSLMGEDLPTSMQDVSPKGILAEPGKLWSLEMVDFPVEEAAQPLTANLTFRIDRDAVVNALASWFWADFGDGLVLTNAPDAPETHWGQFLAPLRPPQPLVAGSLLQVRFASIPSTTGYSETAWSVRLGSEPWLDHDTREGHHRRQTGFEP